MFTALLDTCTLWPNLQRDFLLSLANEGMYRPIWSPTILEELEYQEIHKLIRRNVPEDQATTRARHLIDRMRAAFIDSEVTGWEGLEGTYGLPDPDDEHVVAAAVVGGAGAIVTNNEKGFPESALPSGIEVIQPCQFAANTVALNPARALLAVEAIAGRSGNTGPALTVADVLTGLTQRYRMNQAVALILEVLG